MKTPEELATEAMQAFTIRYDEDVEECSSTFIHEQIAAAIEADRKQRNPGSASDREELARKALDLSPGEERERALASVVRLLINRPDVIETTGQMVDRLMPALLAYDQREGLAHQGIARAGLRFGIEAGLNAAFESWEPDDYAEPEGLTAAVRRALLDREDTVTADWVVANEDELWGSDLGPLLDSLQRDHGAWSPSGEPLSDAAPSAAARFDPDTERAMRSELRAAIAARGPAEYDKHDDRL